MSDYTTGLRNVQARIRSVEAIRDDLHIQRAKLIREAKAQGMRNRDVAKALDVYETHIYRIQNTGREDQC